MPYGCIYEVTNTVNNKIYIGQTTKTVARRWQQHLSAAKTTKETNALHNAIRKYGPDKFTIELVTTASSREELDRLEQTYISGFNTLSPHGYNLKNGGANGKYSEETLLKMSKALKGKKAWNKGMKMQKLDLTVEQRKAISDRFRDKPSKRRKPIQDATGRIFESISEASKILGISTSSISQVCLGRHKQAGGHSFSYCQPTLNEQETING